MSASSSGKRKISDEGAAASSRLAPALREDAAAFPEPRNDEHLYHHLPIWGHALDYLPYEEVRSALLLCKMMANEASKYVLALNFTKSCKLDGPSARKRFPNVEEVNVLCLFHPFDDTSAAYVNDLQQGQRTRSLCKITATSIVPILTAFPKLRIVDFSPRGEETTWFRPYPSDVARNLVEGIIGAVQSRMLPSSIESIRGQKQCMWAVRMDHSEGCNQQQREEKSQCSFCHDVCTYFPVGDIIDEYGNIGYRAYGFNFCLDDAECCAILIERPGGLDVMRELNVSGEKLFHFLDNHLEYHDDWTSSGEGKALKEKLEEFGVTMVTGDDGDEFTPSIIYLRQENLDELDRLIDFGFDPKFLTSDDFNLVLSNESEVQYHHGRPLVAKSTFDFLVSRGFSLDEKCYTIFDEKDAPTLQCNMAR